MANTPKHDPAPKLVALNMRLDSDLRHRFKVWCVARELDMSEVLIAHMHNLLGDAPPMDIPKPRRVGK